MVLKYPCVSQHGKSIKEPTVLAEALGDAGFHPAAPPARLLIPEPSPQTRLHYLSAHHSSAVFFLSSFFAVKKRLSNFAKVTSHHCKFARSSMTLAGQFSPVKSSETLFSSN